MHIFYLADAQATLDAGADFIGHSVRDVPVTPAFANALKLFAISASVGSTESLVQPGQLMKPRDLDEIEQGWTAVSDRTMRLSVGIEDVEDLIADLQQALP